MPEYKLSDAVTLLQQQTTTIASLWAVYVAATFAAAGLSISSDIHYMVAAAVTVGFWAFTIGHIVLLRFTISVQNSLAQEIVEALRGHQIEFHGSLSRLAKATSSFPKSV